MNQILSSWLWRSNALFQDFLGFLLEIGRLKLLKRSGWIFSGVNAAQTESIADHSFRTAILTLLLCKNLERKGVQINTEQAVTLALLHDVVECFTHDIDRRVINLGGKAMKQGKRNAERIAITRLSQKLGALGYILEDAWKHLETDNSLEVQLMRMCDRIETTIQAFEYVLQGHRVEQFQEFWQEAKTQKEKAPSELVELLDQILVRIKILKL
ncbi:MAG: HD domain-containing protein [Candidatus Heimdallarchaeota archaeon]